ncbi:hypothetical protein [Actinomadura sp. NPDC000929]|uniref:hypothetical protein n=1 Tax=Actinomadura sp. NPDC000929 TaxID=3154517 RepID=UPI003395018D
MAILVSRVTRRSRFGSSLWRRSAYALAALPAGLASLTGARVQPALAHRLLDVPSGRPGRFRTILHALLSLPLGVLSLLAGAYGWGIVVLNLFYPARWLIGMGGSLKDAWGGPTLAGAWAVHATGGLVMLLLIPALMKGITTLQARLMVRVLGRADGTIVR